MLTEIELEYFKCFDSLSLPLRGLTLLSGANSSGKSSVLQALVLLHQTMREHEWSKRLMLNGATIRLGTVADVVDQVHGRRTLRIGIVDDEQMHRWDFSGDRSEMSMALEALEIGQEMTDVNRQLRFLLPAAPSAVPSLATTLLETNYLTAERNGPREVYLLADPQVSSVVGPAGEYAVSNLYWGSDESVNPALCLSQAPKTLLRQVEERMKIFFPGFGMTLQQIPQVNAVTVGIRTSDATDFHRPTNVGFGLTQVLPIISAALSAKVGGLLLIENPEVHLHPAGQSQMGGFLAEVAYSGVQVIVESHSDHVLNGIRKAIRSGRMDPTELALHFFAQRLEDGPQVSSPIVDANGSLDFWPDGFFDQMDKDAGYLAGWS